MLEAVRTLASASEYALEALEDLAVSFGNDCLIPCSVPAGVLIRACKEHNNLKQPEKAATSCARIVAAAEALVDASREETSGAYHALNREVDNLRSYSRNATRKASPCCV